MCTLTVCRSGFRDNRGQWSTYTRLFMHEGQESFHLKLSLLLSLELKQSSEGIYKTRGLRLSPDCSNLAGSRLKWMCFIADETMRCASRWKRRKPLLFNPEVRRQNSWGCSVKYSLHLNSSNLLWTPLLLSWRLKVLPPSHRTKMPNKFKWRLQRQQHKDLHEGLRLSDPSQINKKDLTCFWQAWYITHTSASI